MSPMEPSESGGFIGGEGSAARNPKKVPTPLEGIVAGSRQMSQLHGEVCHEAKSEKRASAGSRANAFKTTESELSGQICNSD